MAQDDILCTCALHHGCTHLACVCTTLMVGTVLGTHGYHAIFEQFAYCGQVNEGSTNNHFTVGLLSSQNVLQLCGQSHTFLQGLVHLPVACNNLLSHNVYLFRIYRWFV